MKSLNSKICYYFVKVSNVLCNTNSLFWNTKSFYEESSLLKWLGEFFFPVTLVKMDFHTKCPPERDVISRMIWWVKRMVLQKVGCICTEVYFVGAVSELTEVAFIKKSMSFKDSCSCVKATSSALLRNSMLTKWTYVFPLERIF